MAKKLQYFLDDFGQLWKGPSAPESTLHYASFQGFRITDGGAIWVLECTYAHPSWQVISEEQAEYAMGLFTRGRA